MKELFNKATNSVIISSIIALIVGIVMIAFPKLSIETIGIIVAIYFVVHGFVLIFLDFKASELYIPFDGLFTGVLSILLGAVLLYKPDLVPVIITIVIGVWMILSSINYIRMAIKLCNSKLPWLAILLLGILDLIVGIVMILNPLESTLTLELFVGIMLIIHSIINIVDMIIIKKDVSDISKELDKRLKEVTK